MLQIIKGSIFDSPAQTLVNTVNTVGVMGKGIAKGFAQRYPEMFREYKELCGNHTIRVGVLHCWRGPNRWVLNFPTKTTWKKPSKIEYVEQGLITFVRHYRDMGIQSASFPPLGCGNGQLEWSHVRPMMLKYLWNLDIPVFIHEWFSSTGMPEQYEPAASCAPLTYEEFLRDLHAAVDECAGRFKVSPRGASYFANFDDCGNMRVHVNKNIIIPDDLIATAWAGLRVGLLTRWTLGIGLEEHAQYLLPIVASLAYVQTVRVQLDPNDKTQSLGLFFAESSGAFSRHRAIAA